MVTSATQAIMRVPGVVAILVGAVAAMPAAITFAVEGRLPEGAKAGLARAAVFAIVGVIWVVCWSGSPGDGEPPRGGS